MMSHFAILYINTDDGKQTIRQPAKYVCCKVRRGWLKCILSVVLGGNSLTMLLTL